MYSSLSFFVFKPFISSVSWFLNPIFPVPQEDEKFLTEVFAQLTDDATEDSKRRELVSQTHCQISRPDVEIMFFVVKCRNRKVGQYCNVDFHYCENKSCSVLLFLLYGFILLSVMSFHSQGLNIYWVFCKDFRGDFDENVYWLVIQQLWWRYSFNSVGSHWEWNRK